MAAADTVQRLAAPAVAVRGPGGLQSMYEGSRSQQT